MSITVLAFAPKLKNENIEISKPLDPEEKTTAPEAVKRAIYTNPPQEILDSLYLPGGDDIENSTYFDSPKFETFSPVIERLVEKGVDTSFINRIINDESTTFEDKFVKMNVTGYLKKPDYSSHYNDRSVSKSKEFHVENIELLEAAEEMYKVDAEAITSILWVETRHGGYTGNNKIVNVFLSTAMANEPEYIQMNLDELEKHHEKGSSEYIKLEKKIRSRAKRKSKWALEQLEALSQIEDKLPYSVTELEGSWAGAFGWSQFLPTSYKRWAVDGNEDGKIDLFDKADAIFSVANYLKAHGWTASKKKQRKAVYGYNHSNDYVHAVLKLKSMI
ncbi:MAG: hypothetical protein Kapaf2KO_04750 [Candidatus Kapaibacteriales bacterium]